MIISFLNNFNSYWEQKYTELKNEFREVTFNSISEKEERLGALQISDAVVTGRLTPDEIKNAPRLKVIFVPFTGLNNFPSDEINKKEILISNTHANAPYVAEKAVTLALTMLGKVTTFHDDLKAGKWNRNENVLWESIRNKNAGIVGFGNIGREIAKILKLFGCKVFGYRRNPENTGGIADEVSTDLPDIISKSDIVFVCLPLNPETRNLINHQILAKMKGKYLINVGRGETINEEGLYNALKDGIIKGAALDVWYKYPGKNQEPFFPASKPFWELSNVVLSPHKSSQTAQSIKAMVDDTCENIRSYILNGIPKQIAQL